jgi:HAL2 family 3'(2'),5'-bisphosphate nucleotidase
MGNAMANCLPDTRSAAGKAGPKPFTNEKKIAIEAVTAACRLTVKVQESLITQDSVQKKDRSPVTVADFGSQAIVISYLSKAFPEDPIIAEENSKLLKENPDVRTKTLNHVKAFLPDMTEEKLLTTIDRGNTKQADAKRWWTLDPVDGTLGFLRKEQYAVALALMENNQPVLGILGCPNLPLDLKNPAGKRGCILIASKGGGAWMRSLEDPIDGPMTQIHVAAITDPAQAVCTESVEASHSSHDTNGLIAKALGVTAAPVRLDSQCKYSVVSRGDSSIYLRLSDLTYREKIWDHAAGVVIAEEAGGKVTDFEGKPLDFSQGRTLANNTGIVCAPAPLHPLIMDAIKKVDPFTILKSQPPSRGH